MRRQFARGLVGFVAVWPLVTLVLQFTFHVDPWKLMSFGMYSVPPRRPPGLTLGALSSERASWPELDPGTARVRIVKVE